jgi:hypothetical protein
VKPIIRFVLTALALVVPPAIAQPKPATQPAAGPDALDETLALVGLQRQDLGWIPKGWWPRWPADVPYKLRAFDSLFAEPLDTITYTRSLARTAWEKLDPAELDKDQQYGMHSLFHAVQRLGLDAKFGGFRGYTANTLAPELPLDEAILKLLEMTRHPTKPSTFGLDLPYPKTKEDLAEKVKVLPAGVSPILGRLVLNIIDAHYWAELAFRNVDGKDKLVVANRFDLNQEMIDAFDYCPQVDDVAHALDEASLWNAGQKCVQALDDTRVALKKLELKDVPDFAFDHETPWGWIRIRGGGNDAVDGTNALLIVDLGGDDHYTGGVAASTAERPIGLLLDMAGNDHYESTVPAMGAGICGVGVLIDAAGNDTCEAGNLAQGAGQFGLGVLADLDGDDHYSMKFSGQGYGYFGVGLLLDCAGNDEYRIWGDGQGLGGAAGVGVLADRTGNDKYLAERKCSITGRPSYHSPKLDVCVSNVQGCGMGRRADGADGHSAAGGLGVLLDGAGDDYYSAGNWSMGTGYWFGIGLLHDGGGNDEYHGVIWSQGTGAHFCIGVCIDEDGNDQHLSEENSTNSLAFAHDFTIGILLDATGNDAYSVATSGLGGSINRSVAMLLDLGGDDTYKIDAAKRAEGKFVHLPGYAENPESFRNRGVADYFADTTSIGLFLDIGGNDTYWGEIKNDTHWLDPPDSPNWADRNFSVGVDRPDGHAGFTPRPVRPPSGPAVSH